MSDIEKKTSSADPVAGSRRQFLKTAGIGGAALAASTTFAAPAVHAQSKIRWRLQTYSGAPLGAHVIKPQIEAFNAAANGEMEIELYYADQLVPTA
ncbi:twin-arginine translocation signal domain-containing protein, partial [Tistrella mobilis]